MAFPHDEQFEEDSGVWHDPNERPTLAEGRRQRKRQLAEDPDYRQGRIIKAIIELRRDVDELFQTRPTQPPLNLPQPRPSIKPQVTTAGVSGVAATIVIAIYQLLRTSGVIK